MEKELKYILPAKEAKKYLSGADLKTEIIQDYCKNKEAEAILKNLFINLPKLKNPTVRLRKETSNDLTNHILTIKKRLRKDHPEERFEQEIELSEADYNKLVRKATGGRIIKDRYYFYVDIKNLPVQLTVDVFKFLAGKQQNWNYCLIEVEYQDERVKEILRSGKHGLEIIENAREVTNDPKYTNETLAKRVAEFKKLTNYLSPPTTPYSLPF